MIRNSAPFLTAAGKGLAVLIVFIELCVSPFGMRAFAAQRNSPPAKKKTVQQKPTPRPSKKAAKSPAVADSSQINKAQEAPPQRRPRKISLKALDLDRTPSEEELKMAGQLGSPLSPSRSASPLQLADAGERKKQESDNVLFGQAIQKWNQHKYPEAITLFRKHRQDNADSPWAGEAELHLGCAAQFSGSWDEAKFSFEWILGSQEKGSDIYQKAKLRRSVLHIDQGQLEEATASFNQMLETETDWERRTYAQYWIRQLSLYKANEVALRDCGTKSLAYVLRRQGETQKAGEVSEAAAPGVRGFSLGELADLAHHIGLSPIAIRANRKQLENLSTPFIAHYSDQHFVVVTGFKDSKSVRLFDPRLDRTTELTFDQFDRQWSGLALIFSNPSVDVKLATAIDLQREMGGCCGIPKYPDDLGPKKPLDCDGMPAWQVNPVNMNLVLQDIPMWYDSEIGPKIAIEITYNSQDSLNQLRPFGNKWVFNYSSYAMESPGGAPSGSVLIVMPGGAGDTYQPDGVGGYTPPPGNFSKLTKLADYTFDLLLIDGTTYHYGVPVGMIGFSSLLLSIEDRNHNVVSINHDSSGAITGIKDPQNRQWVFTHNAQGLVSRIDDPFGRYATFSYDTNNNLTGQTDMGGLSYGYTYDSSVYLTSVAKPSGTTTFYIEPTGGSSAGAYPPPGAVMWENYRITVTDPLGFKEEYYYNGDSGYGWYRDKNQYQVGGATAAALNGPQTRYDYTLENGQGVISTTTYADGKTVTVSNFNTARQPQTITDENNNSTQLTYNALGRVLTRADARNVSPADEYVTTYTYAANNFDLVKITDFFHDSSHPAVTIGYDSNRNISSVTDALGRSTIVVYNSFGQPQTVTEPNAQVKTYNYNSLHRLTSVTQNGNTLFSISPDTVGRSGSVTNANGYTVAYTYDALNRLLRVNYPDTTYTENKWGCCHLDAKRDRYGNFNFFSYDAVNRLALSIEPGNRITAYAYDPVGNLTKLVDPNRNATRWEYDQRYRMARKIYADGRTYRYDYDSAGNVKHQIDAKQVQVTYDYDVANNLVAVGAPGLATISFSYDSLNRRTQMSDGVGNTAFAYNLANELVTIDGPWADDTVTLNYDELGRSTGRAVNNLGSNTILYDSYGRPQSVTNPLGTFSYNYPNAVSTLLSSITSSSGPTKLFSFLDAAHDQKLGEVSHKDSGNQIISKFSYEYNVVGQIKKWTQQIGSTPLGAYNVSYDNVGQLKSALFNDNSGALLKTYGYVYDGAGNRTTEAIDTLVTGSTPNKANQLTTRQGGIGQLPIRGTINEPASSVTVNGSLATVKADNTFEGKTPVTAGNNTVTIVATDVNGNAKTNNYNVTVTGSGSTTFVYDANGNLTSDGIRTFEWDPLNRLAAVASGTYRSEFFYNGLNQRVAIVEKDNGAVISTKNLILAGSEICEERDADNNIQKRYYAQGMQIGATSWYYTRDHAGSIREITDASGTLQTRYDYEPYGRRSRLSGTIDADFGFTGHYHHAPSGLNLTLYRAYDPEIGRWISRDPVAEKAGFNLYAYVSNDPLNAWDPLGLDSWYNVFNDWLFERGASGGTIYHPRQYDSSNQITQDLTHDQGVQRARDAWNAQGRPSPFTYPYNFGVRDYFRELFTLDGTGSLLGSYEVTIIVCPDGSLRYSVKNTTGYESGTRSPIPGARRNSSIEDMLMGGPMTLNPRSILNDRMRSSWGPGGNFYQQYYWSE